MSAMSRPRTVLIVDQDDGWREAVASALKADYRILRASSGESALAMLTREEVDAMLLDVDQPGISGFETLRIARENFELTEVVMTAASSDVDHAVEAVKLGAFHFVPKTGGADAVRALIDRAIERQALARQVQVLSAEAADTTEREFVVGPSRALQDVVAMVRRVASLSATVLILGESGTGKELLARLLHRESESPDGPFVAVNLAAIPQELVESVLFGHEKGSFTGAVRQQIGKFELAGGGTLFLDEIGDLKLDLQAKLLRAIQEGEIERIGSQRPIKATFRLIAATNVDLDKAVKEGRFRDDLFYRINVIPVKLPPLRERIDDLPELARFFLRRYNTKFRKQVEGISESSAPDAGLLLVARQHPRAGEPDRAAGGHLREELDHRGRPAVRVPDGGARPHGPQGREPVPGGDGGLRAEPARAGPREERLERDGDGALPGPAAQHDEVQAGEAGRAGVRQAAAEQLRDNGPGDAVRLRLRARKVRPRGYLRGSTASLSAFWMRALTTVLAGILMASPVAGLRPILALRFCTTSFTIPGSVNSPARFNSFSASAASSSKYSRATVRLTSKRSAKCENKSDLPILRASTMCVPPDLNVVARSAVDRRQDPRARAVRCEIWPKSGVS